MRRRQGRGVLALVLPLALIHRSAYKGNSRKSISTILQSPTRLRTANGLFSTLRLIARHKILEQRIVIRCFENHRTRWTDMEPSANCRVGVGQKKCRPNH